MNENDNMKITQLKKIVKHLIVQEQVNMNSKEGRELKKLMINLIESQNNLEKYTESIKSVLVRQQELKKEADLAEKVLFNKMNELQHKTLKMANVVAEVTTEAKYKRVEPTYKDLYNKAYEALSSFSMEQAKLVDALRELEINAKKAETVQKLKVRKISEQLSVASVVGDKIYKFFTRMAAWISNKFGKTIAAADDALMALQALK